MVTRAFLWKWPWTLITWRWLLTSVGSFMNFKIIISYKWLWTLITWKRFLISVGSFMNFKITFLWKWLLKSLLTLEIDYMKNVSYQCGFFMTFKITILWKWLWTLSTWKMFLTSLVFFYDLSRFDWTVVIISYHMI